jgi:hypothetical protein
MTAAIDSLMHEYASRYSARDIEGVTELCLSPFVAIREGAAIHLADRAAVRDHFMAMIDAYRDAGYASFAPVAIDIRQLGDERPSRPCAGMRWTPTKRWLETPRRPITCSRHPMGGASSRTRITSEAAALPFA